MIVDTKSDVGDRVCFFIPIRETDPTVALVIGTVVAMSVDVGLTADGIRSRRVTYDIRSGMAMFRGVDEDQISEHGRSYPTLTLSELEDRVLNAWGKEVENILP